MLETACAGRDEVGDYREIDVLNRIAAVTAGSGDIAEALPLVLDLLSDALHMQCAALSLLDQENGKIYIDFAKGLSGEQIDRGQYRLGEGVTGKVAATGRPAVIPHTLKSPDYLGRAGGKRIRDSSFVCVPVKLGDAILGVISVGGDCRLEPELHEGARILGIVAALLAHVVKVRLQAKGRRPGAVGEDECLREEPRERFASAHIIGRSREMQIVFDQIAQVANSSSTVLINGETGTGKELVARALHYSGSRADKPFIRVNCAALPESLIESELFGHEKGAFTGAVAARAGRFERADGGSIFLDEIGDVSPLMQVKLLRVLQEREFERVGGNRTIGVDVRVIAATHRDLFAMTRAGTFRGDLFYRINVFPIYLLPLRKRLSDLPLLAEHFLDKYAAGAGKNIVTISPEALDMMNRHSWPGNVRELENCMEHAVILADGPMIRPEHLPASLRAPPDDLPPPNADFKTLVDNYERGLLIDALKATGGNITRAAERLRATPRMISYRVRQLDIDISAIR